MHRHLTAFLQRLTYSAGLLTAVPGVLAIPSARFVTHRRPVPVVTSATTAVDSTGTVRGRVSRADSRPGNSAVVLLEPGGQQTVAASDGSFRFDAIARGAYVIRVSLDRELHAERRIRVRGGDTVNVELRLGPTRLQNVRVMADRQLPTAASAATKSSESLLETPYSLSVVTTHQLEVQRPLSLNEALRYSAGVQAEQFGGVDNAFDFIVVRGFFGGSNGIFHDGVQLATPGFVGFRVEPYGTESLEILRGAASVLAGQSSPGGMVNAITKRAPETSVRDFMIEGGNFGTTQGRFDVGGPVQNGALSYRVTGLARSAGTQVEFGKNDRLFVAPAIAWHGAKTSFDASVQLQKDRAGHFQFLPAAGTYLVNPSGVIPVDRNDGEPAFNRYDRRQIGVGYRIEHRVGPQLTLRQTARYDHASAAYDAVFGTGLDSTDVTRRRLLRQAFTADGVTDGFTIDNHAEVRVTGNRVSATFLAGGDYQHYRFTEADGIGDAQPIDAFTPAYGAPVVRPALYADATTTRAQTGVYLNSRTLLYNRLAASLGIRQNFLSSTTDDRLTSSTTSQRDQKFRLQAGLAYLSPVGFVPHVSYSESFLPVIGIDANGKPFTPESGRQFEAGLRYQPRSRALSVAAAAFELRRQNVPTPSTSNPQLQIQTGEVQSRGIELEATGKVATGLTLISALTMQDVTVTKSNAGDQGKRPFGVANSLASLWLDYESTRGPLAGVGFGAGARYQGATFSDPANTFKVDGFTLMDATVRYDWRRIRLAVNAQNVLDTRHVAGCSGPATAATCYYGRARTIIGSARYRW
jgi:iron complex outermembrane recepter protein